LIVLSGLFIEYPKIKKAQPGKGCADGQKFSDDERLKHYNTKKGALYRQQKSARFRRFFATTKI